MSDDDPIVISLDEMWVKVGIGGSAVWTFILFIISNQGLRLYEGDYDFNWFDQTGHWGSRDDSLIHVISGCAVIWLLSFLFLRKKPTN